MELGGLKEVVADLICKYRGNDSADERLSEQISCWSDIVVHDKLIRKAFISNTVDEYEKLVFKGSKCVCGYMSGVVYDLSKRGVLSFSELNVITRIGDMANKEPCRVRKYKVIKSREFYEEASFFAKSVSPIGFLSEKARDDLIAKISDGNFL